MDSEGSIVPCLFSVVPRPIECFVAEAAIVALQDLLSHEAWVSTALCNPVPSIRWSLDTRMCPSTVWYLGFFSQHVLCSATAPLIHTPRGPTCSSPTTHNCSTLIFSLYIRDGAHCAFQTAGERKSPKVPLGKPLLLVLPRDIVQVFNVPDPNGKKRQM